MRLFYLYTNLYLRIGYDNNRKLCQVHSKNLCTHQPHEPPLFIFFQKTHPQFQKKETSNIQQESSLYTPPLHHSKKNKQCVISPAIHHPFKKSNQDNTFYPNFIYKKTEFYFYRNRKKQGTNKNT